MDPNTPNGRNQILALLTRIKLKAALARNLINPAHTAPPALYNALADLEHDARQVNRARLYR